jgi:hypothetical protein
MSERWDLSTAAVGCWWTAGYACEDSCYKGRYDPKDESVQYSYQRLASGIRRPD